MRTRLTELLGIDVPIFEAPMAGAVGVELAAAVCGAGGLGALPAAMLPPERLRADVDELRSRTDRPFNVNFFCHEPPAPDADRYAAWSTRLAPYYTQFGVTANSTLPSAGRQPFDESLCTIVEELQPRVVSFHFGLPSGPLVDRVRAAGAVVVSTATSVAEARWLEEHGCDVVIAQGAEAGGHRGMFLERDPALQVGTMALVPQVVDAVTVPVVAAGGIADARGIVAALVLGASGVQLGTAFLRCPEALTTERHRQALADSADDVTAITNVFTGRPARAIVTRLVRELGPITPDAPDFPLPAAAVGPLRAAAEAADSSDFTPLWSGQAGALARDVGAGDLVRSLANQVDELVAALGQ